MITTGVRSRSQKLDSHSVAVFMPGEKAFIILVISALCWTLVYGIIIKLTFGNDLLFKLKTYVPEALMVCALVVACFSGILKRFDSGCLVLYIGLCIVFCLGLVFDEASNALLLVRDIYIPMLFLLCIVSARLSDAASTLFFRILIDVMVLYVIGSIGLYAIEAYQGYEWTARFYTGYVFWGQDPVTKVAVNSNGSAMRLPALTGSSVKSAMYGVLALCVLLADSRLKGVRRVVLIFMTLVCIALFNNRSSLLAAIVVLLHVTISRVPNRSTKMFLYSLTAVGFVVAAIILSDSRGSLSFDSMYQRFAYWGGMFNDNTIRNLIIPTSVFSVSSGGEGLAGVDLSTVWDNGYLYFLFAFGLPAFVALLLFFGRQWKKLKALSPASRASISLSGLGQDLIIATATLSLATNVFQGRSWFFVFALVFGAVMAASESRSNPQKDCSLELTRGVLRNHG